MTLKEPSAFSIENNTLTGYETLAGLGLILGIGIIVIKGRLVLEKKRNMRKYLSSLRQKIEYSDFLGENHYHP
jgi:hypothetical protein